jgi:hypothetical protein
MLRRVWHPRRVVWGVWYSVLHGYLRINDKTEFPAKISNFKFPAKNSKFKFPAKNSNFKFPAKNSNFKFPAKISNVQISNFPPKIEISNFPPKSKFRIWYVLSRHARSGHFHFIYTPRVVFSHWYYQYRLHKLRTPTVIHTWVCLLFCYEVLI